jgi:hypothetical protein
VRITAEIHYHADPGTVFLMICAPAFQERKCVANGALAHEVEIEEFEDGGAVITTHRTLSADGIPDFVKTVVGETLKITQTDDWTTLVEIAGAPVRFTGSLRLEPTSAGSRQAMVGDLRASVPLIGGKIEKAAEPGIRAAVRAEQRTSDAWLADA